VAYIRNGTRAHLDALKVRQQIAAAEIERAEKELAELNEAEHELARLQRRKEAVTRALAEARERTATARRALTLPPPIHGGPEGLQAAAAEAAQYDKRKRGSGT
jgi:uncharacterized protein involved in exopolysaccharide biosynthesis